MSKKITKNLIKIVNVLHNHFKRPGVVMLATDVKAMDGGTKSDVKSYHNMPTEFHVLSLLMSALIEHLRMTEEPECMAQAETLERMLHESDREARVLH